MYSILNTLNAIRLIHLELYNLFGKNQDKNIRKYDFQDSVLKSDKSINETKIWLNKSTDKRINKS